MAVLSWLQRRSLDPPCTSVVCYWKKSTLAKIGTAIKGICLVQEKDLDNGDNYVNEEPEEYKNFFANILEEGIASGCIGQIIMDFKPVSEIYMLSLHHLIQNFIGNKVENFIKHCQMEMLDETIDDAEKETRSQSNCLLWYELRFGRITASILYQTSKCKTNDGSLVERIMGARLADSLEMRRGRNLEPQVLKVVERLIKQKIKKSGLILSNKFPIFGASPDGLSDTHVYEIKCPKKEATFKKYFVNGKIAPQYRAQVQLQMLFARKKRAYFCVAYPNFEQSKKVEILEDTLDVAFLKPVMIDARDFWMENIFNLLKF